MSLPSEPRRPGPAISTLLIASAFSTAVSVYFCLSPFLRFLPPSAPVAVGAVTIGHVSKLRDYATALLFLLVVPAATVVLESWGARLLPRLGASVSRKWADASVVALLVPLLLSPLFYLTTRKEGWTLLLPAAIGAGTVMALRFLAHRRWLRELFVPELVPVHAFLMTEAAAWLIFRYLESGRRLAHIETLFLELPFIAFFLLLVPFAGILLARTDSFTSQISTEAALRRIALVFSPLLVLPFWAAVLGPAGVAAASALVIISIAAGFLPRTWSPAPASFRRWISRVIVPSLLFVVSYAATASPWNWIDLFHRGESLGPASDYLRGKIPFRDVFVLHGLLDDGFLDAGLMRLFGRDATVSTFRIVLLASLVAPLLWYLGLLIFDRLSLALLVVGTGFVTSADNQRAVLAVLTALLLLAAIKRESRLCAFLAGTAAAVAVFQSLDIGIYSLAGGFLAIVLWALFRQRLGRTAWRDAGKQASRFALGALAGALPFLIGLSVVGALGSFFQTSFSILPSVIDATWSLPYPDLKRAFASNLTLRGMSDFFLGDKVRYLLNFVVLGIAAIVVMRRAAKREERAWSTELVVLGSFVLVAQRTALGRADFPHQYFAAYLIAPLMVILPVIFFQTLAGAVKAGRVARSAAVLAGATSLATMVILLWIPDLLASRLDETIHYAARMRGSRFVDPGAAAVQKRIDQLRLAVWKRVPRDGSIFDFSDQPALYFYLDRPNATRFYQIPIASQAALQAEAIRSLERNRPAIVLRHSPEGYDVFDRIPNDLRAAALAAYLDDHYKYETRVEGVEIWTRSATAARRSVADYLRAIRIPEGLPSTERMLFPSVASLDGANGSHWQSDLIIANPAASPLTLHLRFFAENAALRTVTIPARTSTVWRDVVATLFGSRRTNGILWIEYPAGRRPPATVSTYDSSHPGVPLLSQPFPMENAVSPERQIVFTGVSSKDRRINLGVVNIGDTGTRFRIYATGSNGIRKGSVVEGGALENGNYFLVDAPRRLGIDLEAGDLLHVEPLVGSAVAFLTISDPATGETASMSGLNVGP